VCGQHCSGRRVRCWRHLRELELHGRSL
jgi:hypothetical protein